MSEAASLLSKQLLIHLFPSKGLVFCQGFFRASVDVYWYIAQRLCRSAGLQIGGLKKLCNLRNCTVCVACFRQRADQFLLSTIMIHWSRVHDRFGRGESVNCAIALKNQECVETQTYHLKILGKDKYSVCQGYFSALLSLPPPYTAE